MNNLDLAREIQQRVLWDGIIDPFRERKIEGGGEEIVDALSSIFGELEYPQLVILPYSMAGELLWYNKEQFRLGNGDGVPGLKLLPPHCPDTVLGFFAHYREVKVIAVRWADFGWVTTSTNPRLIDGNNTQFITQK